MSGKGRAQRRSWAGLLLVAQLAAGILLPLAHAGDRPNGPVLALARAADPAAPQAGVPGPSSGEHTDGACVICRMAESRYHGADAPPAVGRVPAPVRLLLPVAPVRTAAGAPAAATPIRGPPAA
jgi:hypothetical protein